MYTMPRNLDTVWQKHTARWPPARHDCSEPLADTTRLTKYASSSIMLAGASQPSFDSRAQPTITTSVFASAFAMARREYKDNTDTETDLLTLDFYLNLMDLI
jgi:hypothetical protein